MIKKVKRKHYPHRIKPDLTYSTKDILVAENVHIRTVQEWYRQGLKRIDNERPFLVKGFVLKEFLDQKNLSSKRKCEPNEFFCMKCKSPRKLWENAVSLKYRSSKTISMSGWCLVCNTVINKIGSVKKLPEIRNLFDVIEEQLERLEDCDESSCNTDMEEVKK